MKKRILFIDDEELVLQSLKRVLYPMNKEWEMSFVDSGAKALALMLENPFDIVISDMLMPGMSGAQLLDEVRRLYPATVRFILSGHAPGEEVFKSIASSDHFFSKPADVNAIKAAVQRVSGVEETLIELHQNLKAQSKAGTTPDVMQTAQESEEVTNLLRVIKKQSE